jgi:hypothetical protein
MPARRKINLEKVRASLATPCPHCGYQISASRDSTADLRPGEVPAVRSHFYHKRNGLNRETEVHGGPEILNEVKSRGGATV